MFHFTFCEFHLNENKVYTQQNKVVKGAELKLDIVMYAIRHCHVC